MRKMLLLAAFAASTMAVPTGALAQRVPVLVVDTDTVLTTCTACRAAATTLQQQAQAAQQLQTSLMTPLQTEAQALEAATKASGSLLPSALVAAATTLQQQAQAAQQLQTSLMTPLQTEAQALEAATKALGNKEPDAALKQRAETFRQRLQSAQQQVAQRTQTLRSTEAHVQQQLGQRLIQVVEQVRARRDAAVVLSKNSTIANAGSIDVTTEVLTALNQALPAVSVTPLPQQTPQQQQQQPQGR